MKKFLTPPMRAVKGSFRGLILGSLMLGATASFAQDKITTTPKHDAQTVKFRGHNAIQGVVRVKFKNTKDVELKLEKLISDNKNGRISKGASNYLRLPDFPEFSARNSEFGAINMKRVFRPAGKYEARHQEWGLHLWYEIEFKNAADLDRVLDAYSKVADVAVAEPRYEMSLNTLSGAPNDPQYSTQANHYDLINALDAWGIETGSSDVVVAIEDQGVDYTHPDLQGHMWTNPGETPNNGIDDDNNGYVDDYYGYNFGNDNGNIAINYHGTHVGGTVSAETNNGVGVAGVAGGSGSDDGVRLMSLSVFGNNAQGGFDEAFIYAADNGAVISQNSWGGGSQSAALENAIDYFIANAGGSGQPLNGGLVVFAAGNSNSQTTGAYPGRYAPVLSVASTTYNGTKSSFSNYGSWVDISAPGSNILSTYPVSQGSYNTISGTSMACPHVSGVAALVASKAWRDGAPLTAAELRSRLESTANFDLLYNANSSTYDGRLGAGMLDAYAALGGTGGGGGGGTCDDTEVTLTLTTDNYGSETTWSLTDGSGSTIATGSGYGNNQTYTETFCLTDGDYTFTINDSYGDGICCSYGNGSYAISDGSSTLISGGEFTSTESKDFTIGSGGGTSCDTPTGLASSNVTYNSFTVSWNAVSGASSYDVEVNGSIASDDATNTSVNLTGASANTTYSVKVRANCSGGSSAYSSAISVTTPDEPSTGGCTGGISSFPYTESFESSLGAWSNGSGDDTNWTRDSGGTPSSGTGPSSGSAGSYYVYLEASGNGTGFPNKTAYLNSPCFDLSAESEASFSFDYHMNGTAMGSLALQLSSNDGSTWTTAWSISGTQGNSWQSASVDLATYLGGSVQARFLATSGSSWSSDIAIDNISVGSGSGGGGNSAVTLTLVTDNYGSETSWTLTDDGGSTIASGSGYANNQTYTETFNLSGGCYTFTINDSYGDGICCSYGNGSYTLADGSGVIATGGDFNSSATEDFCVSGTSDFGLFSENTPTSTELDKFGFTAFPNPASSSINIRLSGSTEANFIIVDITGKEMSRGTIANSEKTISISHLPSGMYIIKATTGETSITQKIIKE
ncbi:hypothetical protein GCM10027429_26580 [Marivirga atlantica]|jgi:subtilisin family serine protease|uniref:S8 family serine peptidase n=1 Tax=Marivirga atlantica TaxID=1548457 RepID=A0A937ACF2_9BACT|nr:S8 family serine peptidase [Marivirga atlantica]MBL0766260.1 S8 family serine peptidase [Marivirga atlantica]